MSSLIQITKRSKGIYLHIKKRVVFLFLPGQKAPVYLNFVLTSHHFICSQEY